MAQQREQELQATEATQKPLVVEVETVKQRVRKTDTEIAVMPCRGEGPYASCPKIRRAVDTGKKIPTLEGEVVTLSLEVEVQRNALVQISTLREETFWGRCTAAELTWKRIRH